MKQPSLLLVDDDPAFRQVMAVELGRMGYEVDAVGTGEEAIQRVAASEPEVVLLDLRLPGMGGLEALKAIQASAPATEVIMYDRTSVPSIAPSNRSASAPTTTW